VRERIKVLTRESTHPRDDVATLLERSEDIEQSVSELRVHLKNANEDLRRAESGLADGIAHARQVLTADLNRLQDVQAADRAAARSRDEDLERRLDQMVRGRGDPGRDQRSSGAADRTARAGADGQVRSGVTAMGCFYVARCLTRANGHLRQSTS
jgi:chromosome segregation ATPase